MNTNLVSKYNSVINYNEKKRVHREKKMITISRKALKKFLAKLILIYIVVTLILLFFVGWTAFKCGKMLGTTEAILEQVE